jgi:hypothetical protein
MLGARAAPAEEADYPCFGEVRPLRADASPSFGVISLFIPPLLLLEAAARDELSDRPRHRVRLSAEAPASAGAAVRIAIVHEGERYLGDLADGETTALPEGRHVLVAARVEADGTISWGRREITVAADGPKRFAVPIDRRTGFARALRLGQLAPDGRAPAGSAVHLDWEGPWQSEARVAFTRGDEVVAAPTRVGADRPLEVEVPGRPGSYRLRLDLCAPRIAVARLPIEVSAADVRLDAPDKVTAGQPFQVHSIGRNGIEFSVAMIAADGREVEAVTGFLSDPALSFTAPIEAGRYTLVRRTRVEGEEKGVELARRSIEVMPGTISITAPERIRTGQHIALDWTGSSAMARLELWSLGSGGRGERRVRESLSAGDDVRLPVGPGAWELRLVSTARNEAVLARRRVEVEGGFFTQVPSALKRGEHWAVGLAEEPAFFDEVAFVPRGGGVAAIDTWKTVRASGSRAVDVVAPSKPGAYDLLIVSSEPTEEPVILDRRPIDVK